MKKLGKRKNVRSQTRETFDFNELELLGLTDWEPVTGDEVEAHGGLEGQKLKTELDAVQEAERRRQLILRAKVAGCTVDQLPLVGEMFRRSSAATDNHNVPNEAIVLVLMDRKNPDPEQTVQVRVSAKHWLTLIQTLWFWDKGHCRPFRKVTSEVEWMQRVITDVDLGEVHLLDLRREPKKAARAKTAAQKAANKEASHEARFKVEDGIPLNLTDGNLVVRHFDPARVGRPRPWTGEAIRRERMIVRAEVNFSELGEEEGDYLDVLESKAIASSVWVHEDPVEVAKRIERGSLLTNLLVR